MLYVFIESSGTMMKFDMNFAVKKVLELKNEISKCLPIPVEDQVLLCSGGEELKSDNIVGNYYGAGTDTNPIFLFSKFSNASECPHDLPPRTQIDLNIEDDVLGCANMTPSTSTVTVRTALALRFVEAAVSGRRACDELVHGQHLQQQGWAAVIANLEDAKESLIKRKVHFEELYQKYLAKRSCYQETIKMFPADIELLAKVPLLPKLMLGNECIEEDLETEHTLLSWFCSEPPAVLKALTNKYQKSLDELNEHTLIALNAEIRTVLEKTDNPDIKEIKGIEERLSQLNKRIEDAKMIEKDQDNLAKWCTQCQQRLSNSEPAIIREVCETFQEHLVLMLENHKCLKDILKRCTDAKVELSGSINYRIKFICQIESEMYDLQVKIIFLEKHVRSVMKQYESFHQVHLAPQRYLKLLAEVCRRRVFSSSFMKWATDLSAQAFKLYHKEISIRKSFESEDSKNMVDNLFPGMDDVPPPFAIECPQPFDQNLPNILREDLDVLRIRFPELAHFCEVPPPDPMPQVSQAETDSAFSSNLPSTSRIVGDSADSGGKSQPDKGPASPQKLAAPSGDYSSLPSEYASLPNEVFSLTPSPFEEPLLPNNDLELTPKRTKMQTSELSAENASSSPIHEVNIESDGEEFETVDRYGPQYGPSDMESGPHPSERKRSVSAPRPNSTSEVINVNRNIGDKCPKLSKARSDGDAISPIQERLKHSDSLIVSADFQATEYYIDDSMPSSYTESNATSPLLRGNRMVKSHHLVVAELQKQVDDKNGALMGAMSSLKNSRSNILKLHAKISALQKFIQELQGSLHNELSNLKAYVKEEFWERMVEVSQIVEKINNAVAELQKHSLAEKEEALNKAKQETECLENAYLQRLEVECQKLTDAESQIATYEEYLRQMTSNLEEIKHEKQQLQNELELKKEVIKRMMLEHELELDSLRNQMKQEIQGRDEEICKLTQNLGTMQSEIENLQQQKSTLEEDRKKLTLEKEYITSLLDEKEADFSEKLKDLKQLQEEIRRLQDNKHSAKIIADPKADEKVHSLMHELEHTRSELCELRIQMERCKAKELSDLEEKLNAQHRDEIESLRSRYKLAISTTAIEKTEPSTSENVDSEHPIASEDLKKIIAENREQWETEKDECIKLLLEEQEQKLKDAVAEAVNKEGAKYSAEKVKTVSNLRREYEENLEKMKSRLMAEIQVSFNEAMNSVTKEKDSIIDALRSIVSALEGNLISIKFHLDKHSPSDRSIEAALSQSDSGASSSSKVLQKMDEDGSIQKLRAEIEPYLNIADLGLPMPSQGDQNYSEFLKKVKLSCRSKIGPCIDCTYKISILSCDVGDLILLCYEEKHESFVVFHFGQFVHFLHTESLQPLGLKIPAGPSERWALGVVTNKEFCVTRKPYNRYKINLGAKFYRVKVKPWDREKALGDYQLHRNSQSTAHSSRTLSAQSSLSDDGDGAKGMSASAI